MPNNTERGSDYSNTVFGIFTDEHRERWIELKKLIADLDSHGADNITSSNILRLGKLYQSILSDLAFIRNKPVDPSLRVYLNNLACEAYGRIYRNETLTVSDIMYFFAFDFPALFRKRIHFVIVAFMVFLFSTIMGFLCTSNDSKLFSLVFSERRQADMKQYLNRGQIDYSDSVPYKPIVASQIMSNNIRVSFMAFALGLFFGIGSIIIMITNGLLLGGLAAIFHSAGYPALFWSLILPHGGIELLCIFIAGGGGLILGYALINPGRYFRNERLAAEGMDAIKLLTGTIPLFILAALIETYITPAKISYETKFIIATAVTSVVVYYLLFSEIFRGSINKIKGMRNS